jgi:manganese transport protein
VTKKVVGVFVRFRRIIRLIAIPAVVVISIFGEGVTGNYYNQVILSLQLGFAIIPLIHFVSDKSKCGISH